MNNFLSRLKYFFARNKRAHEKSFNRVFNDYLKIRRELHSSDVKINDQWINFKVSFRGSLVPFWLPLSHETALEKAEVKVQESLAVIAVGLALNLNLVEISQTLKEFSD